MKNNKPKHTIIETLSAYLDGQLSEQDTQVLRQRLETDAALRTQLDGLRQTRYVLRRTPKLKRRRSFILSPEMVRQQKTFFRAMNVSRMISVAASVLLLATLGSQYLFAGGMGLSSAPMADSANYEMAEDAPAEEPMMAMEGPDETATEESAMGALMVEPSEEVEGEPADAAGDAADVGEAEEPAPPLAGEPAAEETAPAQAEMVLPTATPAEDQRSVPMEKDVDGTQAGEDSASPPGLGEADQMLPADDLDGGGGLLRGSQISALQIVQAVLLVLVIAGGLTAAYFRKKVR